VPPPGPRKFRWERASGENFSEPSAGTCAARGCAQVTDGEKRKARSENKSMLFTERGAAEFISGDTEGGRPPGRRHPDDRRVLDIRSPSESVSAWDGDVPYAAVDTIYPRVRSVPPHARG
jgi:hypothetical protein